MRARTLSLLATTAVAALLLAGCSAPPPKPLTAWERDSICVDLRDSVVGAVASAVYQPVFAYRSFGPSIPGVAQTPYPDCAYLVRSENAERLELFYFARGPAVADELGTLLADSGWVVDGNEWALDGPSGEPSSTARVEHFFGAGDADPEVRVYAELIARQGVVVSVTTLNSRDVIDFQTDEVPR